MSVSSSSFYSICHKIFSAVFKSKLQEIFDIGIMAIANSSFQKIKCCSNQLDFQYIKVLCCSKQIYEKTGYFVDSSHDKEIIALVWILKRTIDMAMLAGRLSISFEFHDHNTLLPNCSFCFYHKKWYFLRVFGPLCHLHVTNQRTNCMVSFFYVRLGSY